MARPARRMVAAAGTALLVVATVATGALAGRAMDVGRVSDATRGQDVSAPASLSAENLVRIAVIGDSYTGGSDEGGYGAANWTVQVSAALDEAGLPTVMSLSAPGGTGYIAETEQAGPFGSRTGTVVDSGTDVVVVFGSRNDGPFADQVGSAAADLYAEISRRAPDASLLVIGAPWVDENVPEPIVSIREQLAREAEAAGAEFLDPIADKWFFGDDSALIGDDGVHPTDDGHAYMAEKILPALQPLVADAAEAQQ